MRNLNQLWLGYSFGSRVVRLEINVWHCFENLSNCCLFPNASLEKKFSQQGGRSLWEATVPATVINAQNYPWLLLYGTADLVLTAFSSAYGCRCGSPHGLSSSLDCQHDSLFNDKCREMWHRGPCCEERLKMRKTKIITFSSSLFRTSYFAITIYIEIPKIQYDEIVTDV